MASHDDIVAFQPWNWRCPQDTPRSSSSKSDERGSADSMPSIKCLTVSAIGMLVNVGLSSMDVIR